MFANALVDKIWNHKFCHFKNLKQLRNKLFDELEKLLPCYFPLKDQYEFFNNAMEWSSYFSMKSLLSNSNIQKISFLYAPEILPELNIFLNDKKETVKLNSKTIDSEKMIKISIVHHIIGKIGIKMQGKLAL